MNGVLKMLAWAVFGTSIVSGLIVGGIFLLMNVPQTDQTAAAPVPQPMKQESTMTFRVTVPKNTPEGDTVYLHTHPNIMFQMDKVGEDVYELTLHEHQIELDREGRREPVMEYRYTRNGLHYITAEYLEPDTSDYFWKERGRRVTFAAGATQEDVVKRWRWMPKKGDGKEAVPALDPGGDWEPRVDGVPFRSGQVIQEVFVEEFEPFETSTAEHLVEIDYGWVIITPAWDWLEQDPMPKLGNPGDSSPVHPDTETLLAHIEAFKAEGLKVAVAPRVCCTTLDATFRQDDWWKAYFQELERMLVSFAEVAEEGGADAFYFPVGTEIEDSALEKDKVYPRMIRSIRKEFSGEVGQQVWSYPPRDGVPGVFPKADWISWGNELDFFVYQTDLALSSEEEPSEEALLAGAAAALDATKLLYDLHGKPVMVQMAYPSITQTWRGKDWYDDALLNAVWGGEFEWQNDDYDFSGVDQARVVRAYFEAARTRPWVVGLVGGGYWHWAMPLAPDMSVRGKISEDVWERWNRALQ